MLAYPQVCVFVCRETVYISAPHTICRRVSVRVMCVWISSFSKHAAGQLYIYHHIMIHYHNHFMLSWQHHHQFILATGIMSGPSLSISHHFYKIHMHCWVWLGNMRLKNASLFHSFLPLTWHLLLHTHWITTPQNNPLVDIWIFTHPPPFICIGEKTREMPYCLGVKYVAKCVCFDMAYCKYCL